MERVVLRIGVILLLLRRLPGVLVLLLSRAKGLLGLVPGTVAVMRLLIRLPRAIAHAGL